MVMFVVVTCFVQTLFGEHSKYAFATFSPLALPMEMVVGLAMIRLGWVRFYAYKSINKAKAVERARVILHAFLIRQKMKNQRAASGTHTSTHARNRIFAHVPILGNDWNMY